MMMGNQAILAHVLKLQNVLFLFEFVFLPFYRPHHSTTVSFFLFFVSLSLSLSLFHFSLQTVTDIPFHFKDFGFHT